MAKLPKDAAPASGFKSLKDKIDATILESRRIFICDSVMMESANEIIAKLWYLELTDPGKPITFVINSPGGSVDAGFAIWDQVKMISSPVATLVTGMAASMGSVLSLCAPKGMRFATENARIMIHQPRLSGAIQGQATDLERQAKEMIKTRNSFVRIYVDATGKDAKTIERAIDRDTWFSAQEALDYGLLSGILNSYQELEAKFA